MWTLEIQGSYFFHQHGLVNVSDDVISLCVRGSEPYSGRYSVRCTVDKIVGAPLFMKGK